LELAIQLRRDLKPQLDKQGVKLFLVSIGTYERSKDFVRVTGFPAENLLVDPENVTYTALGLYKNVQKTFFDINTPLAIKKRMDEKRMGDLQTVLSKWEPWLPPKPDQAYQQGGMYVFEGSQLLFSHQDPSTGAHADLTKVLSVATAGLPGPV